MTSYGGFTHTHYLPATQRDIAELKREIAELRTHTPIQYGPELTPEIVKVVLPPLVREIIATYKDKGGTACRKDPVFCDQMNAFFGLILTLDTLTCTALARHLLAINRVTLDQTRVPMWEHFEDRTQGFISRAGNDWHETTLNICREWGLA